MVTVRYNKPLGYDLKDNPREIKDSELSRYLDCGWTLIKENRAKKTTAPAIIPEQYPIKAEVIVETVLAPKEVIISSDNPRKRGRPYGVATKWK